MTSPVGIRGDRPGVVPRISRDDLVAILVLGVLYYAAARLGLRLAIVEDNITPLWPPTGLALVAFLRYGRRLWPGVAIAAFLVNLPITNVPAAVLTAAGNTLAPIVAALRDSSRRKNGRKTSSRRSFGTPGPSSLTSISRGPIGPMMSRNWST